MSRLIQFQILRGTKAQLITLQTGIDPDTGLAVNPLQFGELYLAEDESNLYIGTPGLGKGFIQIGDTTAMNETLQLILMEMRAMRMALIKIACEDGTAEANDFNPKLLTENVRVPSDIL